MQFSNLRIKSATTRHQLTIDCSHISMGCPQNEKLYASQEHMQTCNSQQSTGSQQLKWHQISRPMTNRLPLSHPQYYQHVVNKLQVPIPHLVSLQAKYAFPVYQLHSITRPQTKEPAQTLLFSAWGRWEGCLGKVYVLLLQRSCHIAQVPLFLYRQRLHRVFWLRVIFVVLISILIACSIIRSAVHL